MHRGDCCSRCIQSKCVTSNQTCIIPESSNALSSNASMHSNNQLHPPTTHLQVMYRSNALNASSNQASKSSKTHHQMRYQIAHNLILIKVCATSEVFTPQLFGSIHSATIPANAESIHASSHACRKHSRCKFSCTRRTHPFIILRNELVLRQTLAMVCARTLITAYKLPPKPAEFAVILVRICIVHDGPFQHIRRLRFRVLGCLGALPCIYFDCIFFAFAFDRLDCASVLSFCFSTRATSRIRLCCSICVSFDALV